MGVARIPVFILVLVLNHNKLISKKTQNLTKS